MKYVVRKRITILTLCGWFFTIPSGIMVAYLLFVLLIAPEMMDAMLWGLFVFAAAMLFSGVLILQLVGKPRIKVVGNWLYIEEFQKKKKVFPKDKINGRRVTQYWEQDYTKSATGGVDGAVAKAVIRTAISKSESWKRKELAEIVYFSNGERVFSIHTGMKNAQLLDMEIVEMLHNQLGYEINDTVMGEVEPILQKADTSMEEYFKTPEKAESYLGKMIGPRMFYKVAGVLSLVLLMICIWDILGKQIVTTEITMPLCLLFGTLALICLGMWALQAHNLKMCLEKLKDRMILIQAANELYALGGVSAKPDQMIKVSSNFVYSKDSANIIPIEDIIWIYTKGMDNGNQIWVFTQDGKRISVGIVSKTGNQDQVVMSAVKLYKPDVLWGYSAENEAICIKLSQNR